MSFEGSVKWPKNAVQPTHPKTALAVEREGGAVEVKTDKEWRPKGTWRPEAVTFSADEYTGFL